MDKYYQLLPDSHPCQIMVQKSVDLLTKGENVLVGGVHGVGGKTFLTLFCNHIQKNHLFEYVKFTSAKDFSFKDLKKFKNQPGIKLVIIDFFEQISNKQEYIEKLHQFRQPENNIVYLALTDHEIVSRAYDYNGFSSPVFSHHLILTPFDYHQTHDLVKINQNFYGWNVPDNQIPQIYTLTGGIPRFIKHVCKLANDFENTFSEKDLNKFYADPIINFELQLLTKVVSTSSKNSLQILGLTDKNGSIKSLLLQRYLRDNYDQTIAQYFPSLSNLEGKLFALLHQNTGSLVTIDQIGDVFELLGCEFSPWAIYKLVSRLKPKLSPQYNLKCIKGKGYLLTAPKQP